MTRHHSLTRHSRSRSVPGMRRCRTCSTLYTSHAMICPHCYPHGGANLALAAALGRDATESQLAPGEFVVDLAAPSVVAPRPTLEYPAWLATVSAKAHQNTFKLFLVAEQARTKLAQDFYFAVAAYREHEPIPASVDLAALEREAAKLLERS